MGKSPSGQEWWAVVCRDCYVRGRVKVLWGGPCCVGRGEAKVTVSAFTGAESKKKKESADQEEQNGEKRWGKQKEGGGGGGGRGKGKRQEPGGGGRRG